MSSNSELGSDLSKLASTIVKQALEEGVDIDTRSDVLKTAGAFYISAEKIKLKMSDDAEDMPTFNKFKDSINGAGKAGHG